MNSLPLHILDIILFKLDIKSVVMMLCTNRSIKSHISDDPNFEIGYSSRAQSSFICNLIIGNPFVIFRTFDSSFGSMSPVKGLTPIIQNCYILGTCSGHVLLYKSGLFVVNPLTKRFRLLNHSGSMLLGTIIKDVHKVNRERAMCVGFAVDQSRTTKRFKIICILEIHTMYAFEISEGDSWRLSKTTITTNSKSDLTKGMKPVYLEGTLHWLRNDGSIIAFNTDTEQARFIPSIFHADPVMKLFLASDDEINRLTLICGRKEAILVYTLIGDTKWALAMQINNILITESELEYWNVVAYDGKHMVVKDKEMGSSNGVVHVYNMEDNIWRALWPTKYPAKYNLDFFKFTPFFSFFEQTNLVVATEDRRLTRIMRLINTTKLTVL